MTDIKSRPDLLDYYRQLDQGSKIQAECALASICDTGHPTHTRVDIWIDGDGELRSKTTTCDSKITDTKQLKEWNFDGSSTNQAPGHDSDVYLRPVAFYKDPMRGGNNILVCFFLFGRDKGSFPGRSSPNATTQTELQTRPTTATTLRRQ